LFLVNLEELHHIGSLLLGIGGNTRNTGSQKMVALQEFSIDDTIGESLTSNTDTFEDTIALQLIKNNDSIEIIGLLTMVRNDATDEVRIGRLESVHQMVQLFLVMGSHSDEGSSLPSLRSLLGRSISSRTTGGSRSTIKLGNKIITEEISNEWIGRLLHGDLKIFLQRIFVLLEPVVAVIGHLTGIVMKNEVNLGELNLFVTRIPAVVLVQLGNEGLFSGLGHNGLLIKSHQDSVGLLVNEINGHLGIKTEINEGPIDLLTHVLLLFELEHVVVEELLQLLIGVVDANLLEGILLEDFESGNIQNTNEELGLFGVKHLVHPLHDPKEESSVDGLGQSITRVSSLLNGKMGLNDFSSGLDSGLAKSIVKGSWRNIEQLGSNFELTLLLDFGTFTISLDEGDVSEMENTGNNLEEIASLNGSNLANVHSQDGMLELLIIAHSLDSGASGDGQVVESLGRGQDVIALLIIGGTNKQLIEDVEASFTLSTIDDTGLLEQVRLKAGSGNETTIVELQANELSETGGVVVLVGFGITEGLQKRVEFEQLLFKDTSSTTPSGNLGNVLNDLLGVFSLSGSRFSGNEHGLVLTILNHHAVSSIGDGEDVRSNFVTTLSAVEINHVLSVDGNHLVRVDGDTEETGVGVDKVLLVAESEIVEDSWFIQMSQLDTILNTVELGGILRMNIGRFDLFFPSFGPDLSICAVILDEFGTHKSEFLVRNPHHFLIPPSGSGEASLPGKLHVPLIVGLLELLSASHY
jgi:hypothetical protein